MNPENPVSTTRIHLIRHGQTNWNRERRIQGRSESTLTQQGREQAAALREQLLGVDLQKVYCSSSLRTRETAEILFAGRSVPTEYCDDLREIHLGSWEGALWEQMMLTSPEIAQAFWERPHEFTLEGAETFAEVQQRAVRKFLEILGNHVGEEVAVISHGVLIKSILCHLEQRPIAQLWKPPHLHNCAHSIVELDSGERAGEATPRIVQYADRLIEELDALR